MITLKPFGIRRRSAHGQPALQTFATVIPDFSRTLRAPRQLRTQLTISPNSFFSGDPTTCKPCLEFPVRARGTHNSKIEIPSC